MCNCGSKRQGLFQSNTNPVTTGNVNEPAVINADPAALNNQQAETTVINPNLNQVNIAPANRQGTPVSRFKRYH